jgi:hypothetical protein
MAAAICFICGTKLRWPLFPYNLAVWRPKAMLYSFETKMGEDEYLVKAVLCGKDGEWANANEEVANVLLTSKIKAHENI